MIGTYIVIRTTQFYEGFTTEALLGEDDDDAFPTHELKLSDDFKSWLNKNVGWDNWQFDEVADKFPYHWHAYDDAKAGIPVGLRFWFADKSDAALAKLTWHQK